MYSLLKKLTCCPGVSGREMKIAALIRDTIAPYTDEVHTDAMGNLIAVKRGTAPEGERKKLLYCAHMDEIGFIVTFIEDSGLLRLAPIGGINFVAAAYTEVVSEDGVRGVIVPDSGTRTDALTADKFGIDIGAASAAEAGRRVKIGDCFSIVHRVTRLSSNRVCGRPLDDRVGCAILVETAKRLAEGDKKPADDIYYVFSVQEEVGCRGSKPAGFAVAPDYALAFDVTGTGDVAGAKPMAVSLGGGAAIKIKDSSVICSDSVIRRLGKLADDGKIKHQYEILTYGGTDTSSLQAAGAGCEAGAISIPTRYIHSSVELLDLRDVEACVKLATAFALSLSTAPND